MIICCCLSHLCLAYQMRPLVVMQHQPQAATNHEGAQYHQAKQRELPVRQPKLGSAAVRRDC